MVKHPPQILASEETATANAQGETSKAMASGHDIWQLFYVHPILPIITGNSIQNQHGILKQNLWPEVSILISSN